MEPITRREMYLAAAAGYDVDPPEPITREEVFLAKLAGMDVETPGPYTRRERFIEEAAVAANKAVIEPLTITENGTYTAPAGVDGYNPVTVNVAGSSADLRYVTFMSYDGLVEYGKKAVAVGDDCADPIARGIFDTPTRESDAQYNYTFYGWATEPNGAADADWNKAVTEDKTVYANFASAVRYYTITYYDEDGTTVLKTESIAYGSTPSYIPVKEGYTFNGWTPALTFVTADAGYISNWIAKVDFASLSWAKIAEYAESGQAAEMFEIGATKTFVTQNNVVVTAKIIGFNHDDLSDGSGKAGITLEMDKSFGDQRPITTITNNVYGASFGGAANMSPYNTMKWDDCSLRSNWHNTNAYYMLQGVLPSDLTAVIKEVSKKVVYDSTEYISNDKVWLLSLSELGFTDAESEGECYAAYTPGKTTGTNYTELKKYVVDKYAPYKTRSKFSKGIDNLQHINGDGSRYSGSQGSGTGATIPCFCI